MAENTDVSQPGSRNTQPSPVESSQLVSGQSSELPTQNQTVMASKSCSTRDSACTQNSTVNPGKAIDFHFGEPGETASVNQQVVSAEQEKSPAGPQLMELNSTPKTCLPSGEKIAVLDTAGTLCNECSQMRTLNPYKILLIPYIAICENPRITFGNHQMVLSGSHAVQSPHVDHSLASAHDQTFSADHEKPFNGDQTHCNQMKCRNGGQLTLYGNQMTSPIYSWALLLNQITSFSNENSSANQQGNPAADNEFYRHQMILPTGNQAFYEPQMRANCDQTNDPKKSFSGQNVCKGQENLLNDEQSLSGHQTSGYKCDQDLIVNHQVTSPIDDQSPYHFQIATSSFDTTLNGSKRTTSSSKDNLTSHSETSPNSEETFDLSQMRTSIYESVYPNQNRTPNLEKSLPQVTSLGNQAPSVGKYSYPSSSPLIPGQPQENSSASSLVKGQHPEMKLVLKSQSPVSLKTPHPLKPYACTYPDCQKSYKKPHHLKYHMKKHTGEKNYVCDEPECESSFFCAGDLKRHKQTHTGERPYPCSMCKKRLTRLEYLKQHERRHLKASPTTAN